VDFLYGAIWKFEGVAILSGVFAFCSLTQSGSFVQPLNQSGKHHILWSLVSVGLLVGFCLEALIFLRFPPFFLLADGRNRVITEMAQIGILWSYSESISRFPFRVYSLFALCYGFRGAPPAGEPAWLTLKASIPAPTQPEEMVRRGRV
jgi:hypothetical protein